MKTTSFEKKTGKLFSVIGNPFRVKLLLAIGKGEACVCHLEALLGKRQAFISQHLMALRKAGLLKTRREGKYMYYRLTDLDTLDLIRKAGQLAGMQDPQWAVVDGSNFMSTCPCPKCESMTTTEITKLDNTNKDPQA